MAINFPHTTNLIATIRGVENVRRSLKQVGVNLTPEISKLTHS